MRLLKFIKCQHPLFIALLQWCWKCAMGTNVLGVRYLALSSYHHWASPCVLPEDCVIDLFSRPSSRILFSLPSLVAVTTLHKPSLWRFYSLFTSVIKDTFRLLFKPKGILISFLKIQKTVEFQTATEI